MNDVILCYLPNTVEAGHRGDDIAAGLETLDRSTELAVMSEQHGWAGALIGTGWGRPDTFTVATALAARTTTFQPLIAVRPGFWSPAQFASAAATLDQISRGRVLVNVVSGSDQPEAYGDDERDRGRRYARTREFMHLVRRLWTEEEVTYQGEHYHVDHSALAQHPYQGAAGGHPRLYFGGASPEAEVVAAAEADVQLFWGEPLAGVDERIARLRRLAETVDRRHAPLQFGLRVTLVARERSDDAWETAEAKVAAMAATAERWRGYDPGRDAVGQQRLRALAETADVVDDCLYTAPARYQGAGADSTWLVGSFAEVGAALRRYRDLGVTHFILSATPYREEIARLGDGVIPRLRATLPT